MKMLLISLSLVLAGAAFVSAAATAAVAEPSPAIAYYYPAPVYGAPGGGRIALSAATVDTNTQQQYFTQDGFGQYSYGYREPLSAKQEVRTLDGVTRGSYSYVDPAGKLQTVQYVADAGGFRVAATNLPTDVPLPVADTAEVAAARAQHLAAHEEEKTRHALITRAGEGAGAADATKTAAIPYEALNLPRPVEDTAEVAAAKVAFFSRYEEEKLRHKLLHDREAAKTSSAVLLNAPQTVFAAFGPGLLPAQQHQATLIPATTYKLLIPAPQRGYLPTVEAA